MQIQDTQIQNTAHDKVLERPDMWYIFRKRIVQGYLNKTHMCQTRKYKNTYTKYINTQIQHMTKCQKDPTLGCFSKTLFQKKIRAIPSHIPLECI